MSQHAPPNSRNRHQESDLSILDALQDRVRIGKREVDQAGTRGHRLYRAGDSSVVAGLVDIQVAFQRTDTQAEVDHHRLQHQ